MSGSYETTATHIPQCVDCLRSLAKDVVTLAASENPGLVEKAEHITRIILEDAGNNDRN
jgi:hypothetical protein